ncbi:MAG: HlyD family secretion protein [Saprospiraceae bacterium]|nr:HlyD family secretion protein [Saprospiraceae bacterium]MCF8248407.1 HlyD family secretion protein [Saprospiraceae bacterium]MCF8280078.1 HlyD family secretion protein [Bacteroidales bacterium]MCF8309935.1 HlyD family secretion protein [Saprospiraceae bacterium]MCF8438734.1 HlyD family secretion protein [Saprospiraceae bacterium]
MQQDNIEYLSGEVKEILSSPPSWVATWGIGLLVGIVVVITAVGGLFRYPEIVTGDVNITTETPPVTVVSQKTEYISELKTRENSAVSTGDILLTFPSDAVLKDVLELEKDLETIGQLDLEKLQNYSPNRNLNIGELFQAYSSFVTAFELVPLTESGNIDYATVVAVDNTNAQLQRQLKSLEASLPTLRQEEQALNTELINAADQYGKTTDTSYTLVLFKINSELKNKQSEIKKLAVKIEELKGEISKSNVRKLQAQTQAETGAGDAIYKLNQKLDELKKSVKTWKDNFLVVAPADGIVQFYSDLKAGQLVNTGDVLFTIMPKDAGENYVGKVKLPVDKSSKVKPGQPVNIKFGRYPFREYGTVKSKVSKVYPVAKDDAFYADILIENGLVTTLNRKLDFYQQMSGKAEIVTDDRTFISKLFEKFTAMF